MIVYIKTHGNTFLTFGLVEKKNEWKRTAIEFCLNSCLFYLLLSCFLYFLTSSIRIEIYFENMIFDIRSKQSRTLMLLKKSFQIESHFFLWNFNKTNSPSKLFNSHPRWTKRMEFIRHFWLFLLKSRKNHMAVFDKHCLWMCMWF